MGKKPSIVGSDSEIRCSQCDKLLGKKFSDTGRVEIKCARCGTLNSVFEEVREQFIITDPEGRIIYANEMTEIMTGYDSKELIGSRPSLWGKQMPSAFYQKMWDVIKNKKKSLKAIVHNKRKDGTLYNALLQISPILNTAGKVQFYVGIETLAK